MTDFRPLTIDGIREAFAEGRTDPVTMAQKVIAAVSEFDSGDLPLRIFISQRSEDVLEMAQAARQALSQGKTAGELVGIPVAIKDELHQKGYPTTVGTSILGSEPSTMDATAVARMRDQGAVLLGKTNMHEIGIGVNGINPHHGAVRNPYDPTRITGGSSSGSAAAVAAGLCPVALGADGGGSIRIPAALCGAVGLKPTFGRVSEHGAFPLCWSVAHVGPIASTVKDLTTAYRLIAGPDPADPNTLAQPAPTTEKVLEGNVEGLKIGVCPDFFDQADEPVTKACRNMLTELEKAGAVLVDVTIDALEYVRPVQYLTIGVEMATALYEYRKDNRHKFGSDTRLLLELASTVPAVDYLRAQRLRTRIHRAFSAVFDRVDLLASPTTARTAAPISKNAPRYGESDEAVLDANTEFTFAANLTGQPAISVPAGYDANGLPIGLQFMAAAWQEHKLLTAAAAVERHLTRKRPQQYLDLLE